MYNLVITIILFGLRPFIRGCQPEIIGGINMKYVCTVCGYVYDEVAGDPDSGIAAGTKWDDVPADYTCPLCGVSKDLFEPA